jgi:hypothetical protein
MGSFLYGILPLIIRSRMDDPIDRPLIGYQRGTHQLTDGLSRMLLSQLV